MELIIEMDGRRQAVRAPFRLGGSIADLAALQKRLAELIAGSAGYDLAWLDVSAEDSATQSPPAPGFR